MSLSEELIKDIKDFTDHIGLAVKNFNTGESFSIEGDELFPLAGLFQIPIAVEFYRQIEAGEQNLNSKIFLKDIDKVPGQGILKELIEGLELSLHDLVKLMLIQGDNTATDILLSKLEIDKINLTLNKLGLKKTIIRNNMRNILFDSVGLNDLSDEEKTLNLFQERIKNGLTKGIWSQEIEGNNVTTANELNQLMNLIADGKAVSKKNCEEILSLIDRCQVKEYQINKYLPNSKIKLIQKSGNLFGIKNISSIVTILNSNQSYVITCLSKNINDSSRIEEALAKIFFNAYNYFTNKE
ncbi:serine hydrolase [Candidatus Bathyarchaeota archaeon]|nr:serine hydrolase [Candidatus Bathyarchaeota archaeon]